MLVNDDLLLSLLEDAMEKGAFDCMRRWDLLLVRGEYILRKKRKVFPFVVNLFRFTFALSFGQKHGKYINTDK